MSTTTHAPTARSRPTASVDGPRGAALLTSPLLIGLLAGAQAVLGSLLCVVAPVLATWLVASATGAAWGDALRVAADGWLLAHGASLVLPWGEMALVPLGLTVLPVLWCLSAGRRVAVALEASHPAADARRHGLEGAAGAALAGVVAAYVVLAAVVALVAGAVTVRPLLGTVVLGALVLVTGSAGAAIAAARVRLAQAGEAATGRGSGRARRPVAVVADLVGLPAVARSCLRAGAGALGWCLVAAAVVVVVSLVVGGPQVLELHRSLDPGVVGGVVLVLGQLLVLPVAVVWALAWVAGPGFSVGASTWVSPGGTDLGPLPALPVLGGLPQPGTGGGWMWVVLAMPVAAGTVAAVRMRGARALRTDLRRRAVPALVRAAGAGAVAGLLAAVLAALASGPVGPGALALVGPVPWQLGPALGGLVALGAAVALLAPLPGALLARVRRRG